MFKDEEFGAGHEFKNEFLSLLYCRIYIPMEKLSLNCI
jgi:hypothetical protein